MVNNNFNTTYKYNIKNIQELRVKDPKFLSAEKIFNKISAHDKSEEEDIYSLKQAVLEKDELKVIKYSLDNGSGVEYENEEECMCDDFVIVFHSKLQDEEFIESLKETMVEFSSKHLFDKVNWRIGKFFSGRIIGTNLVANPSELMCSRDSVCLDVCGFGVGNKEGGKKKRLVRFNTFLQTRILDRVKLGDTSFVVKDSEGCKLVIYERLDDED